MGIWWSLFIGGDDINKWVWSYCSDMKVPHIETKLPDHQQGVSCEHIKSIKMDEYQLLMICI